MKLTRIKLISYVKANAAELVRELAETREPLVVTQDGEARAVIDEGKTVPFAEAARRLRARRARSK
jgi:hypothetical protein